MMHDFERGCYNLPNVCVLIFNQQNSYYFGVSTNVIHDVFPLTTMYCNSTYPQFSLFLLKMLMLYMYKYTRYWPRINLNAMTDKIWKHNSVQ